MLTKNKIDNIFKKEFNELVKIFKQYGYLKTMGSYNNKDTKYINDIDLSFRMNNKTKSTLNTYINCIEDTLTKLQNYLSSSKTRFILEKVKTFQEVDYQDIISKNLYTNTNTKPSTKSSKTIVLNSLSNYNKTYYTITELINDKLQLEHIFNINGIIKINLFFNYNNGEYYIPIDLIIVKFYHLNENNDNYKHCVMTKLNIKESNYIKALKKLNICISVLHRLKIINLPQSLLNNDNPKLKSHNRIINDNIIISRSKKIPSIKYKVKKTKKHSLLKSSNKLSKTTKEYNILCNILKDIKFISNNTEYMYSLFSYANNLHKLVSLPNNLFNKIYTNSNIYKLHNAIKKIISIILKNKTLLALKITDVVILKRIYTINISTRNYKKLLLPLLNKINNISHSYQLQYKEKADLYYKQYLDITKLL